METLLKFNLVTDTVTDGDLSESAGVDVSIRGTIKQLSGSKKMVYSELLKKDVWEFICFDNSVLTRNASCTYGGKTLIIYDLVKNPVNTFTNRCKLILTTK